jgi:hypothetical protein
MSLRSIHWKALPAKGVSIERLGCPLHQVLLLRFPKHELDRELDFSGKIHLHLVDLQSLYTLLRL